MKKAMFGVEIKFLPISVVKKAMFWAKCIFLPTSVEEISYILSWNERLKMDKIEILPTRWLKTTWRALLFWKVGIICCIHTMDGLSGIKLTRVGLPPSLIHFEAFYPLVWMKIALFRAGIKFLPTSVEENINGWGENEVPTPAKNVPFMRYLSLGVM